MNSEQADILDLLSGHTDDTTIERLAFECLLTNMTDDRVVSLTVSYTHLTLPTT